MAAGFAMSAMFFIDDQHDGFTSFLALLQSLDDTFVYGGSLVECSGDKLFPDADGLFSVTADV